jgi:hypothetical protein
MVIVPSLRTLNKYGLSRDAFLTLAKSQGGVCYICKKLPPSQRLFIDHEHVRGWKRKPAAERVKYIRGLLLQLL